MPLDTTTGGTGAEADDTANAQAQPPAQAPTRQPLTIGDVREKYPQYHDMSDEALAQGLHKKFYSDMPFDQFAAKIGFKPPAPPYDEDVKAGLLGSQISQEQPPDGGLARVAKAAGQGAVQGFGGNPVGSVLSDSAQAKLDDIQRAGGWKGTAAQLASTLGTDIGTAGNVIAGLGGAAIGAYQRGAEQAGTELGAPQLGREVAALPEAFPQESMGMRGVLDRGVPVEGPAAATARTMRSPSNPDLAAAAQRAQAGPRIFDVEPTGETPAPPGTPLAIQQDIAKAKGDAAAARAARPAPETPPPPPAPPPITPEQRAMQEEQETPAPAPPPAQAPAAQPPQQATPGVSKSAPEPPANIAAQIEAMTSGQSTKDAVFVAAGTQVPQQLPPGVMPVTRPEGTLLTTNPAKAKIFQTVPLSDDVMAHILGYPETKADAIGSGDPQVVQAVDRQGHVQSEMAASPAGVPAAAKVAADQAPGSTVKVVTPEEALADRSGQPPKPQNPASDFVMMSPDQLKVDPGRFQYKESGERGVTGALQGVTKWEPALANPITAWQDADGNTFVVNGHQRHDLATRAQAAGQQDVQMPARVFRETDGYTPEFMKVLGAYQNIAEGSGTAVDAAKVMRGQNALPSEMVLPQLPPKSEMVRQAQSLSKLSPDAFGMVENGFVPPAYAAHVGELISDPKQQQAALGLLAKADPANSNQARLMVQDIRNSGFLQGTQTGLFGDEDFAKSIFPERMKVLDGAMQALRRNRGLFRAAVEGEDELTAAGNKLSTAANVKARASNDQLTDILQRQATTRGPISDALTEAANDLANGKSRPVVQASFLSAVRKIIERGETEGIQSGDLHGGEGPPGEAGAVAPSTGADTKQSGAIGSGDLWKMSPEELESMAEDAESGNDKKLIEAFGSEERAKEFKRLDRKQNSSIPHVADEGARELDRKFGNLTPKQERLVYGIGETAPQRDDIMEVLDAHRNRADNPEDAGYEAAVAIRRVPPADILAVPEGNASPAAQGAYVRMSNAIEDMANAGVTSNDIAKTMANALVQRGGWDHADAAEVVGSFIEKMKEKANPHLTASLFQPRRLPNPPKGGTDLFGTEKPEPVKAAPEPTIRNDQRQQEMPGMAPSAVQAQKAFDARGLKTNQKPADEGLFARPETPQPQLPAPESARSRFFQDRPGARDLLKEFPDPAGGHVAAKDWVLKMGTQTGNEYVAIVDGRTGRVIHAGTDDNPSSVRYGIYGDSAPIDTYTVHHNHPTGGSLSDADITMLAWPQLKEMIAHEPSGISYVAMAGDKLRPYRPMHSSGFGKMADQISGIYNQAASRALAVVQRLVNDHTLAVDNLTANHEFFDLTNHMLHDHGLIDYGTTRKLSQDVANAAKSANLLPNDRPPRTLQPETGTGGLHPSEPSGTGTGGPTGGGTDQGVSGPSGRTTAVARAPRNQQGLNLPNTPQFEVLRDKAGLDKAIGEIKALLSPTSLRGAGPTEMALRKHGSERAQSYAQSFDALQKVRDAIDGLPQAAQRDFTNRMETGQPQASPALDAVATALRKQLDQWAGKVQGLGKGYLSNAIQDYMGHVWGNYPEWKAKQQANLTPAQMMDRARAQAAGKTPLTGSGAFLKQRTFPTQADGIAAGLIPITNNPVDIQLMKLREMQKYYHGITLSDQMKNTGIARWVPAGQERDAFTAGLDKLDDRVFQPRLTGQANPAGFGRLEPGNWYAPEPAARLFNNYMSRGLMGSTIINGFRAAGNGLNMLQLGMSGFHATFVTLDTMLSRSALGLQQIMGGDFLKGAKSLSIGATPYAAIDTIRQGAKLRSAWLDPALATPEWKALADRLNEGGGRISMDQFYRSNASGPLLDSLKDLSHPSSILGRAMQTFSDEPTVVRKIIAAPVKLAGRVIETMSEPLMGYMVPRAKLGVFAQMARDWQERNMNATPEERSAAMIKAWDSVDNRLGQMVYDNVFWNKTQKDLAFLSTRSVGWNIGTIRELGGGVVDGVKLLNDVAHRRPPTFTSRMAYTMVLPIMSALYGSIIGYLMTGQPPQSMMDLYFPQTGSKTPDGQPERISLPGYMKDVIDYSKAPVQTISNKVNPLLETLLELHKNQDYYGGIIDDPKRDAAGPAYADYLLNQAIPFSWRGSNRVKAEGGSKMDQALSFWGFQPAPKSITQPERGEAFQTRANAKAYRSRAREQGRWAPVSKAWNYLSGQGP